MNEAWLWISYWMNDWMIDWLNEWLNDWLITVNWLLLWIDWVDEWLIVKNIVLLVLPRKIDTHMQSLSF